MSRRVQVRPLPGLLRGFSMMELLVGMGAFALLSAIAIPTYNAQMQKVKVSRATTHILTIAPGVNDYASRNGLLPPELITVGMNTKLDPWGNPYVYLSS